MNIIISLIFIHLWKAFFNWFWFPYYVKKFSVYDIILNKDVDNTPAVSVHSGMLQNDISNRTDELQIENLSESESDNDEREGKIIY